MNPCAAEDNFGLNLKLVATVGYRLLCRSELVHMQMHGLFTNFFIARKRKRHLVYLLEPRFGHEFKEDFLAGVSHLHCDCN
jgi:hypothetical protein